MDLVKVSAASGAALMAALVMVSTGASGRAEPTYVELHPTALPERTRARVEATPQASEPTPTFSLLGPVMASTAVAPVLPIPQPASRLSPIRPSIDRWSALIDEAAYRFGIPAEWVRGVMQQESAGRTHQNGYPIVSSAGAMGLMQVMPATFAELRARYRLGPDPHNPRTNIMAGAAYLREMYDRYGPRYFLAAYNAGPARVDDHLRTGRALPYETRAYTASLMPALVPNAFAVSATTSTSVQDLTIDGTLWAAASASSRSVYRRPASPPAASIFVRTAASGSAAAARDAEQPRGGLFVTSSAAGQRQSALAGGITGS